MLESFSVYIRWHTADHILCRRGDVEGKLDRDAWAAELSPLLNLREKLNQLGTYIIGFAA